MSDQDIADVTECDCGECQSACRRKPGWFAPGEAEHCRQPWVGKVATCAACAATQKQHRIRRQLVAEGRGLKRAA